MKLETIMNKKMTRKKFLSVVGIGFVLIVIFPSMISKLFKLEDNFFDKGKIYHDGELIMEIK